MACLAAALHAVARPAMAACRGDADGDGRVTAAEIVALVGRAMTACATPGVDPVVQDVIAAIADALHTCGGPPGARWWKGNLHTHSMWSDGDQYPEMVLDWYKRAGYHFVALSDHNEIGVGERWVDAARAGGGLDTYTAYRDRFGADVVETRNREGALQVRLATIDESRARCDEPGRFLVLAGEEISSLAQRPDGSVVPVHVNATNLTTTIAAPADGDPLAIMQRSIDAVLAQRAATGQAMIPHVAHPNYGWALSAADLAALRGERFVEVFNGHPLVHNAGDETHPSVEMLWDQALVRRLLQGEPALFGLAVDDAHHYGAFAPRRANPGRGWVMVRAQRLSAASLIAALERGDFYASSGVELAALRVAPDRLMLRVRPEPGVNYLTLFIGARCRRDADAEAPCRVAPDSIGTVLASVAGPSAAYRVRGDELYVRATVLSSKRDPDGGTPDAVEQAWIQPILPRGRGAHR